MRHPHADLIKEWAEDTSRVVECRESEDFDWHTARPDWDPRMQYRFKPEPKPDVVRYCGISDVYGDAKQRHYHNLKLTFDGETGKLKSAEVIGE